MLVDELHTDGCLCLRSLCPYGEAILLALLYANAEIALVDQSRTEVVVARVAKHHIVWTTLEGTIVLDFYTAEGLPAHQLLWEFERAVFYQFTIQSAIGSIVDVLEKDSIHRLLDGCPQFLGVHVHHTLSHSTPCGTHGESHCQ